MPACTLSHFSHYFINYTKVPSKFATFPSVQAIANRLPTAISVGTARGRRRATSGLEKSSGATHWYIRHHPFVIPRSSMSSARAPREDEGVLCSESVPASQRSHHGFTRAGYYRYPCANLLSGGTRHALGVLAHQMRPHEHMERRMTRHQIARRACSRVPPRRLLVIQQRKRQRRHLRWHRQWRNISCQRPERRSRRRSATFAAGEAARVVVLVTIGPGMPMQLQCPTVPLQCIGRRRVQVCGIRLSRRHCARVRARRQHPAAANRCVDGTNASARWCCCRRATNASAR